MPALFIYLIKANIVLTLFYLAYRFGLRRLTFYTLNRYFLLIGITFSAIFPLVDINPFFQHHEQLAGSVTYYAVDWNSLQNYMMQQDPFTIWNLLQYVFWAGVIMMIIRFIIQLFSLLHIHLQSKNGKINNEKVKLIPGKINPFSFFKNIYINPSLHSPEELKTILIHEKVHVREWHTIDILAGEINNIFYWFNPGAWLMKTAIRENLEFITDRKLLRSGVNAKIYQYSLLKTVGILQSTQLANNFSFAHLKHRIIMMNKKRSSRFYLFRYLLLLPVVSVIALVVTSSRGQNIQSKKNNSIVNLQKQGKDTIPVSERNGLPADYKAFLKRNPEVKRLTWWDVGNPPGEATLVNVYLKNGKKEKYHLDNSGEMKKAKEKYGLFPNPQVIYTPPKVKKDTKASLPAPKSRLKPKVKYTPPRVIKDTTIMPQDKQDINGNYFAKKGLQALKEKNYLLAKTYAESALKKNPDNDLAKQELTYIKQMKAYQEKMKEYKEKRGKDEGPKVKVHFTPPKVQTDTFSSGSKPYSVTTFNKVYSIPTAMFVDTVSKNSHKAKAVTIGGGTFKGLVLIDGKIKPLKELDAAEIRSMSVLKGQAAIEKYGEKGKNGVMEIYTNDFAKKHPEQFKKEGVQDPEPSAVTIASKGGITNPLYIVDGNVVDSGFVSQLKGKDIQSITVLKDKKALEQYRGKGKNGVIIIHIKEDKNKPSDTSSYRPSAKNITGGVTHFAINKLHLNPDEPILKAVISWRIKDLAA